MSHTVFWILSLLLGLSVVGTFLSGLSTFLYGGCYLFPKSKIAQNVQSTERQVSKKRTILCFMGFVACIVLVILFRFVIPDPFIIYP
jgi:hypothetical protein